MYKMPGAPTPASVNAMRANATTGVTATSNAYQWTGLQGQPSNRNEFPIVTVPKDSYDDIANIKAQYAQSTQVGDNWVIPFENSDAQFLLRKRDAEEKAMFDAWVTQKYNITDPAQNMMLQRIAPELFTRREEVINQMQDLVSRYAKLRLRGAQSIDDLQLEWLVETKRLTLPKGPIWDPARWRAQEVGYAAGRPQDASVPNEQNLAADNEWNANRYRKGLFNPLKWLTRGDAAWTPLAANPADIYGDSAHPFRPDTVPYPRNEFKNIWGAPTPYPYVGANTAGRTDHAGGAWVATPHTYAGREERVLDTYGRM